MSNRRNPRRPESRRRTESHHRGLAPLQLRPAPVPRSERGRVRRTYEVAERNLGIAAQLGFTSSRCYCGFYAHLKGNGPEWNIVTPHTGGCFFAGTP